MDHYAVVGNPIAHSKSPTIHALFAEQTGESLVYEKREAPLDDFEASVKTFFSQANAKGLNVTVPFKEQAWQMCDSRTERAEIAGAVNTLLRDSEGGIVGDNTDGIGLVTDLKKQGGVLKGKKILIVGAGGAVRGILQPILRECPAQVSICNRTESKAKILAELVSSLGNVDHGSFESYTTAFDIVINGTSASLSGDLPPLSNSVVASHTICYDMMYGADETVFNRWARRQGARMMIDGLGMLVEQAAEAFYLWRDIRPETEGVMATLRAI